jgi:hypothetical protein
MLLKPKLSEMKSVVSVNSTTHISKSLTVRALSRYLDIVLGNSLKLKKNYLSVATMIENHAETAVSRNQPSMSPR